MQLEAANLIKPKPTKDNYTQTTGIKVSHVSGHAISGMIRYFIPNTKGTICFAVVLFHIYKQSCLCTVCHIWMPTNFPHRQEKHRLHYIIKIWPSFQREKYKPYNITQIKHTMKTLSPHIQWKQWRRHLDYIMNKTSRRHHINKFKKHYTIQKLNETARWDLCLLISIKLQRQKTKQIT